MSHLDEIRQAAATLREQAEAATPGPWEVSWGAVRGPEQHAVASPARRDALYMATMDPLVGLALADWLVTAGADLWAHGPLHCDAGCHDCDDDLWMPHVRAALDVARAILRGSS